MAQFTTLASGPHLNFTEGPRPDGKGNVYFTDVFGRGLYRLNADGSCDTLGPERQSSGGCVINKDGRVIYSGRDGLAVYDPANGTVTPLPATIDGQPILGINDIEADPQGNIWGGTLDHESLEKGEPMRPGILFRLGRDGTARQLGTTTIPNGIDFSPDGKVFYFSESGEGVFAYDVADDGTLSGRRMVAGPIPDSDGIVLDVAGGLWVARYQGRTLVHYTADGVADITLETPFANMASVAFGGDDLRTLYIAGGSLSETGTGALLALRVDVPGYPPRMANISL